MKIVDEMKGMMTAEERNVEEDKEKEKEEVGM